ncbi:hypothetical protein [Halioxenophilus aromaticivorans]|uniref:Uncharacterized protein n=1 Tax=Halioxenophilus aromaticivorans TaxID=1306992 RepID=A0AAV3U1M6_9ALTE
MWTPTLQVAAASSPERFAVVVADPDLDDPFSILLEYNARSPQAWQRIDIEREIVSLCYRPAMREGAMPVLMALSNEGDVCTTTAEGVSRSVIPGAGLAGPGGRGQTWAICSSPEQIVVGGDGAQLYISCDGECWEAVPMVGAVEGITPRTRVVAVAELAGGDAALLCRSDPPPAFQPGALQDGMSIEDMMAVIEANQAGQQGRAATH